MVVVGGGAVRDGPPRSPADGGRGWFFCVVCGAEERQFSLMGHTVAHRAAETTSRYRRWYDEHIHEPHAHEWSPRGFFFGASLTNICVLAQLLGDAIGNSATEAVICQPLSFTDLFSGPAVVYLNGLPRFPDQALAERLARRLVHASPGERHRFAEAADFQAAGPCLAVNKALWEPLVGEKGKTPDPQTFRAAWDDWATCHPEWR